MTQLHTVGAQLRAISRCAMVGMLVGLLATQAVAEGATPASPQTTAKPVTTSVPSNSLTQTINPVPTANLPLAAQDSARADLNALPEAPTVPTATTDSASLNMPPELKAMMDDASQNAQNLQPAPATKPHGIQRPGMLVMGICGLPLIALGTLIYTSGKKNTSGRVAAGTIFMVPGAAMSGFGFYFAFKPKH